MNSQIHAVGTLIENEQGQILLLKRHKDRPEGEKYGLPGGKLETDETISDGAVRETLEETNIKINAEKLKHCKTYDWIHSGIGVKFDTFKYQFENSIQELTLPEDEITEFVWMNPKDAYHRTDLMEGLYPILEDEYEVT